MNELKRTDRLIIRKQSLAQETVCCVRVSSRVNAMLDEIAARTGRSKTSVADLLIEFAFERVEIQDEEEKK